MILRAFLFSVVVALAIPQTSLGGMECRDFFKSVRTTYFAPRDVKADILENALGETKITLTKDQKYIQRVLKKWDLQNSTPHKVEVIAQKLVMKKDHDIDSFYAWVRSVFVKPDPTKELARVKYETQVLKEELLKRLDIYGYKKENSKFENFLDYKNANYNKAKLIQFGAINLLIAGGVYTTVNMMIPGMGISFQQFLYPFYFPIFNFAKSIEVSEAERELVRTKGFNAAYPTIKENHKLALGTTTTLRRLPYVIVGSMIGYIGWNYYNFRATEIRYEITEENLIPQTHPLFIQWRQDFILKNGRAPEMSNPKDKEAWDNIVQPLYMAWADNFNEAAGRYPDLSQKQDRQAWQEFVAGIK